MARCESYVGVVPRQERKPACRLEVFERVPPNNLGRPE